MFLNFVFLDRGSGRFGNRGEGRGGGRSGGNSRGGYNGSSTGFNNVEVCEPGPIELCSNFFEINCMSNNTDWILYQVFIIISYYIILIYNSYFLI